MNWIKVNKDNLPTDIVFAIDEMGRVYVGKLTYLDDFESIAVETDNITAMNVVAYIDIPPYQFSID